MYIVVYQAIFLVSGDLTEDSHVQTSALDRSYVFHSASGVAGGLVSTDSALSLLPYTAYRGLLTSKETEFGRYGRLQVIKGSQDVPFPTSFSMTMNYIQACAGIAGKACDCRISGILVSPSLPFLVILHDLNAFDLTDWYAL